MAKRSEATRPPTGRDEAPRPEDVRRLEERTTEELYALAGRLGIPGHMELSRSELIEAIRRR